MNYEQFVVHDWSGHTLVDIVWSGRDLRKGRFVGTNLSGANLRECDLTGADLHDAILRGIDLSLADLAECDFSTCNLSEANLQGANLSGATLRCVSLAGANLLGANLNHADLTDADCAATVLSSTKLRKLTAPRAIFHNCRGNMANFERASLFSTRWSDTVVEDGNFEFADLRNAVFTRCWFGRSCFVGAALEGAQFIECDLTGADFYWSDFDDSKCFGCELKDIRRPEEQKIAYGPKGVKPPVVIPKPLYRQAITEEERQKLLASCLQPPSQTTESEPKK
jgi:uncharacterized protein YjbI with pentapeptide repeats